MAKYQRIFELIPFDLGIDKVFKQGSYGIDFTKYNNIGVYTYREAFINYTTKEIKVSRSVYPVVTTVYWKCKGTIDVWKMPKRTHIQEWAVRYENGDKTAGLYLLFVDFNDEYSYNHYEMQDYFKNLLIREITTSYEPVILKFVLDFPIVIPTPIDYYNKSEIDEMMTHKSDLTVIRDWHSDEHEESGS